MTNLNDTWWVKKNMAPVNLYKLKPDYFKASLLILAAIVIVLALAFCIYAGISSWLINDKLRHDISTSGMRTRLIVGDKYQIYVYVYVALTAILLWLGNIVRKKMLNVFEKEVFVDKYRKTKSNLLDTDYIQKYDSRDVHYVFYGRGSDMNHKFGLFDIQEIKTVYPPIFDDIEWQDKGLLLKVLKDGKWYIIDLNGNAYN